jgi:hypothetical protein
MQALGAFVSTLIFQHFWSSQAGIFKYFVLFITGILVAKLGWQAVWNFYEDYRTRLAWIKTQRPATEKHDGRYATYEEMARAGMYEPKGRILGLDDEGRLLFIPHKLKPSFEYILSPQGSGKTSTRSMKSSLLSALICKRDRRISND